MAPNVQSRDRNRGSNRKLSRQVEKRKNDKRLLKGEVHRRNIGRQGPPRGKIIYPRGHVPKKSQRLVNFWPTRADLPPPCVSASSRAAAREWEKLWRASGKQLHNLPWKSFRLGIRVTSVRREYVGNSNEDSLVSIRRRGGGEGGHRLLREAVSFYARPGETF